MNNPEKNDIMDIIILYSLFYSTSFIKTINIFLKNRNNKYIFIEFEEEKIYALFDEIGYETFRKNYEPNLRLEYADINTRIILTKTNKNENEMIELLNFFRKNLKKNEEELYKEEEYEEKLSKKEIQNMEENGLNKSNIIINSLMMTHIINAIDQYMTVSKLSLEYHSNLEEDKKDKFARYIFFKTLNEHSVGRLTVKIAPSYELLENY